MTINHPRFSGKFKLECIIKDDAHGYRPGSRKSQRDEPLFQGECFRKGILFYSGEFSGDYGSEYFVKGKYFDEDGKTVAYLGEFADDKSHGHGEFFSRNGSLIYRGQIKQNKYDGDGETFRDGKVYQSGKFANGNFVSGKTDPAMAKKDREDTRAFEKTVKNLFGFGSSNTASSSSSGTSYSTQKLGCKFYCTGFLGQRRSSEFRVNTPYTDSLKAWEFVRKQYEDTCKKYPWKNGHGEASVDSIDCQTWHYKD